MSSPVPRDNLDWRREVPFDLSALTYPGDHGSDKDK